MTSRARMGLVSSAAGAGVRERPIAAARIAAKGMRLRIIGAPGRRKGKARGHYRREMEKEQRFASDPGCARFARDPGLWSATPSGLRNWFEPRRGSIPK